MSLKRILTGVGIGLVSTLMGLYVGHGIGVVDGKTEVWNGIVECIDAGHVQTYPLLLCVAEK